MQILRAFRDVSHLAEVQVLLLAPKKGNGPRNGSSAYCAVSRDHGCWLAARADGGVPVVKVVAEYTLPACRF